MLCNPVYIIKQFITSKPTSLDVIGFSIASPCLTSTKAMPSESRPRRLCLRTWFIDFLGSVSYPSCSMEQSIQFYDILFSKIINFFLPLFWLRSAPWPPLITGPGDFFHWLSVAFYHQSQIITGELFFGQSFLLICRIRNYWLVINISFNLQALTSTILSDNQEPKAPAAVAAVIKAPSYYVTPVAD